MNCSGECHDLVNLLPRLHVASFSIIIVTKIRAASVCAGSFWVWNDVLRSQASADVLSAMCATLQCCWLEWWMAMYMVQCAAVNLSKLICSNP